MGDSSIVEYQGKIKVKMHSRYQVHEELGRGAYAVVGRALDKETNTDVAIKTIFDPFSGVDRARKLIREIRLLKHFQSHPNILSLLDIIPPWDPNEIAYVCLSTERMDIDLKTLLEQCTPEDFTLDHVQWFTDQLISGVCPHNPHTLHNNNHHHSIAGKSHAPSAGDPPRPETRKRFDP